MAILFFMDVEEGAGTMAYTVEGFDGSIIEGYRSFPSWFVTPTPDELEVIHKAYKHGPTALIKALETVQGRNKDD